MDENYGDKGFCMSPYLMSILNITKYLIRLWRSETTTHFDHPKIIRSKFGLNWSKFGLNSVFQPIAFFVSQNIFLRNQDSLFLFMSHVEPKKLSANLFLGKLWL